MYSYHSLFSNTARLLVRMKNIVFPFLLFLQPLILYWFILELSVLSYKYHGLKRAYQCCTPPSSYIDRYKGETCCLSLTWKSKESEFWYCYVKFLWEITNCTIFIHLTKTSSLKSLQIAMNRNQCWCFPCMFFYFILGSYLQDGLDCLWSFFFRLFSQWLFYRNSLTFFN